jgi:hypothetical protein
MMGAFKYPASASVLEEEVDVTRIHWRINLRHGRRRDGSSSVEIRRSHNAAVVTAKNGDYHGAGVIEAGIANFGGDQDTGGGDSILLINISSTGEHSQDSPHLLQGQRLQEAHTTQGHAVQSRQGKSNLRLRL